MKVRPSFYHERRKLNTMIGLSYTLMLSLLLFTSAAADDSKTDEARLREYQIKAAFIYNFPKFIDWPEEKTPQGKEPMILGIIGKDVFQNTFELLKDKTIKNHKVVIKRYPGIDELLKAGRMKPGELHPQIADIRKSHLLFICPSEKKHLKEIIKSLRGHAVLTLADTEGFLEAGGIINLLMVEKKVSFEINLTAAQQEKLEVRSKLLRLAKRVVRKKD